MTTELNYWVYLYPTNNSATIHVSYCHYCNNGQGIKEDKNYEENIWRGPYNLQEALQFARENAQHVNLCHALGTNYCEEHWTRTGLRI